MYCHKCGTKASGKHCLNCGTLIITEDSYIIESWRSTTDLTKIARHPEVLKLIDKYSNLKGSKHSFDSLLSKFDLVFGSVTGLSIGYVTEIFVPIMKRLGLKTSKSSEIESTDSMQETFVKLLCVLYKNKYQIEEFYKAKDGAILIAKIESNMQSWGGNIVITLTNAKNSVEVMIQSVMKGQLYDWGRSKKIVHRIIKDLESIDLPQRP